MISCTGGQVNVTLSPSSVIAPLDGNQQFNCTYRRQEGLLYVKKIRVKWYKSYPKSNQSIWQALNYTTLPIGDDVMNQPLVTASKVDRTMISYKASPASMPNFRYYHLIIIPDVTANDVANYFCEVTFFKLDQEEETVQSSMATLIVYGKSVHV